MLAAALTRIGEHQFPLNVNDVTRMFLQRSASTESGQTAIDMRAVATLDRMKADVYGCLLMTLQDGQFSPRWWPNKPPLRRAARDLAALPYSSGTTGINKGVMLTHRNLVANLCQGAPALLAGEGERLIAVLPFFHIYGLVVLMCAAISRGSTLVTMPRFDLEQFLGLLQDQRITRAYVAPPIVLALAKHPLVDNYDLSSLETIIHAGASDGDHCDRERLRATNTVSGLPLRIRAMPAISVSGVLSSNMRNPKRCSGWASTTSTEIMNGCLSGSRRRSSPCRPDAPRPPALARGTRHRRRTAVRSTGPGSAP
mgnify:CR=1 FL=1